MTAEVYTLRIDTGNYGKFEKTIEFTNEEKYKSRSYGILLVTGKDNVYSLVTAENENHLNELKISGEEILLEIRGNIKEVFDGNNRIYEVSPGALINSVIRFDTSDLMKRLYGEASQKMFIRKDDDTIEITGCRVLSIPYFPFVFGDFSITMEDGNEYSLEPDEEEDLLPIEIEWEILKGFSILQQISFFPVEIKNAVIGDKWVSFGGSLKLNFGELFGGKAEDDKDGGKDDGDNGGNDDDDDDDDEEEYLSVEASLDEARFGMKGGSFKFIGLRTETEVTLPSELIPGITIGAEGRLLIDTLDKIYEIEANVDFEILEFYGLITLRFTDTNIPIPDNILFAVGGEPGVPIIPPFPVAYITKGGGGFKNLYDTIMGNYNLLPPLKLVIIGGLDIVKVLEADNAFLEISARGIEFSGELKIFKFPILKEVSGHFLIEDSLEKFGLSFGLEAALEVFEVIKGEAWIMFEYDSTRSGIFGPVSLGGGARVGIFIPEFVPIIGGQQLLGAAAEISTEKIYAGIEIIKIPISIEYFWGSSAPNIRVFADESGETIVYEPLENRGLMAKTYYNDETGEPEGRIVIGGNIKRVASTKDGNIPIRRKGDVLLASAADYDGHLDLSVNTLYIPVIIAQQYGTEHLIDIQDQEMAIIEIEYQGDVPEIELYDPDGNKIELIKDGEDANYLIQEIPEDVSESGELEQRMYIRLDNPANGQWKLISDKPVECALLDVEIPPKLKEVTVEQTGSHKFKVSWDPVEGVDGYYIQLLDENGEPIKGTGAVKVEGNQNEAVIGGLFERVLKDDEEGNGKDNREDNGEDNGKGNGEDNEEEGETEIFGLSPGQNYRVSVVAYKNIDGINHYSQPAYSQTSYLPEPDPAEITLDIKAIEGGTVRTGIDEDNKTYYIVNRNTAELSIITDQQTDVEIHINGELIKTMSGDSFTEIITLTEGRNIINVAAVNENGDLSVSSVTVLSDTIAPELKVESPAPNALSSGENILVKGVCEVGAVLTVDGQEVPTDESGMFELNLSMGGLMQRIVRIQAEDEAGNTTLYEACVINDSVAQFKEVRIKPVNPDIQGLRILNNGSLNQTPDGTEDDNSQNGSQQDNIDTLDIKIGDTQQFELYGVDEDGNEYLIDQEDVEWSIIAGENYGELTDDGLLSALYEGEIVIKASYYVSTDYAFEDALLINVISDKQGGVTPGDDDEWYKEPGEQDDDDDDGSHYSPSTKIYTTYSVVLDRLSKVYSDIIRREKNFTLLKTTEFTGANTTTLMADGNMQLTIPAQLLASSIGVGIARIDDTSEYENDNIRILSSIYKIFLDRPVKLHKPLSIKLKPDPKKLAGLTPEEISNLKIYWYNEIMKRWEYIGGVYNKDFENFTAELPHLSKYALLYDKSLTRMEDIEYRKYKDVIYRLVSIGVIHGVPKGDKFYFEPDRPVTRQEFAKLMVIATDVSMPTMYDIDEFVDKEDIGLWAVPYVMAAVKRGWIQGVPSKEGMRIMPLRNIPRSEALTIIGRILEKAGIVSEENVELPYKDADKIPQWALPYVKLLYEHGVIGEYENSEFKHDKPISREEAALIISKMINVLYINGAKVD